MEHALRCNNLKCRAELKDRALVATCSHIFCVECGNNSGLTAQGPEPYHVCPACKAQLSNPDDVVIANLHPSEDYKASVLSGLSPHIIMECAGKALSFWAYQMTQEIVYQDYLGKTLADKYSSVTIHLDKVINEANSTITGLQNKLQNMSLEYDNLKHKNDELALAFKDKNRKLLQTEELYDRLKQKAMLGQMQDAASNAVTSNIEAAAAAGTTLADHLSRPGLYEQQVVSPRHIPAGVRGGETSRTLPVGYAYARPSFTPRAQNSTTTEASWNKQVPAQQMDIPLTPHQRQRIGNAASLGLSAVPGVVSGTPHRPLVPGSGPRRMREPVVSSQNLGGKNGFPPGGISAGMKTSHGVVRTADFGDNLIRPRAVQHAPSSLPHPQPLARHML